MNTTILITAIAIGAPALKDKLPKSEVEGEWEVVSQKLGNRPRDERDGPTRFVFTADGKWIIKEGPEYSRVREKTYAIDTKGELKTIDLIHSEKSISRGIFGSDGDGLLMYVAGTANQRPTKFEIIDPTGQPVMVYVLKRVKLE